MASLLIVKVLKGRGAGDCRMQKVQMQAPDQVVVAPTTRRQLCMTLRKAVLPG